jgi:hypothetical protein
VNVGTENKDQCRNEQLAAGDAEKGARRADAQAEGDTGNNLTADHGGHDHGRARRQEPLADQQQTDCHQQDGNRPLQAVIGDVRQQTRGKTMRP